VDNRAVRRTEEGEIVSIMRRPPLTFTMILVLISDRGSVDSRAIVRLGGLGKYTMPASGR
jgi:hypothetical protein